MLTWDNYLWERESGRGAFGVGYGAEIMWWILAGYDVAGTLGTVPFQGNQPGVILYRRRP